MAALLELDDITCRYDGQAVVRGLNLTVRKGEMTSLLGSSGSGKSSVLRAIAGFLPLTGGQIRLDGDILSRPGFCQSPESRRVGMVFQDYALFPHLTVAANVAFGLRGYPAAGKRARVADLLAMVGLSAFRGRYPHELSGGQQQRTALARTLAPNPDLVLLDEPFSNLDVDLRERLSQEVGEILEKQGATGILVTHDQHEAFSWGNQVGVLHNGELRQCGTPYALYHTPADRFVAGFVGRGTFIAGRFVVPDAIFTDAGLLCGKGNFPWRDGTPVEVLIRPDDVVPDATLPPNARVLDRAFKGAEILYTLALDSGCQLQSLFPSHQDHPEGARVSVKVLTTHLVAFSREGTVAVS